VTSDGRRRPPPSGPRLRARYDSEIKAQLQQELGLGNVMQVPRVEKIVGQHGCRPGDAAAVAARRRRDRPHRRSPGRSRQVRRAKKSIANFKLREGNEIGAKVTLRGDRMWEFYDRLVSLAIPAHPGLPRHAAEAVRRARQLHVRAHRTARVPEIDYDRIDSVRGMNITIVTTAERTTTDGRSSSRSASRSAVTARGDRWQRRHSIQKQMRKPKFKVARTRAADVRPRALGVPRLRLCRLCLRQMAHAGEVPGMTKSSW
jgi:large subunit ribosomal protein L5